VVEKLQIVRDLAGTVDALHARDIVLGDISFANVLWSGGQHPRVMLLDCDGMRRQGQSSVLPQADTIDWDDPLVGQGRGPTPDQDRYKLALAILRVVTTRLDARPGVALPNLSGLGPAGPRIDGLLAQAAGPAGTRPAAAEWLSALSNRQMQPVGPVGTRRPLDAPAPQPGMLVTGQGHRHSRPVTAPGA
jgi:hypothetical protein